MLTKHVFELFKNREFSDGHVNITSELMKEVAETSGGIDKRFPIPKGHYAAMGWFGDDSPGYGYVTNIRYDEGNDRLLGDVFFTEEMEKDYQDGKYTFWSPGISSDYLVEKSEDGETTFKQGPWEFGHLAMLGSTEAAFKDLREVQEFGKSKDGFKIDTKKNTIKFNDSKKQIVCFSLNSINEINTDNKEEKDMSIEKEKELFRAEREAFAAEKAEMEKKLELFHKERIEEKKNSLFSKMDEKGLGAFKEEVGNLFASCKTSDDAKFSAVIEKIVNFMKAPIEHKDDPEYGGEEVTRYSDSDLQNQIMKSANSKERKF